MSSSGFLDKIDAKLKFLAQHPLAGESRPELAADVRSSPVGNYVKNNDADNRHHCAPLHAAPSRGWSSDKVRSRCRFAKVEP